MAFHQCPYCKKETSELNQEKFVKHLQKEHIKLSKKCKKSLITIMSSGYCYPKTEYKYTPLAL